MDELVITRMWREISKQQYIVIATLLDSVGQNFDLNFHIGITHHIDKHYLESINLLISSNNNRDGKNHSFSYYIIDEIDEFLVNEYKIPNEKIIELKNQITLYNLFLAMMLRKNQEFDYALFCDDDVLINTKNPSIVIDLLKSKKSFGMEHPFAYSDLSLLSDFTLYYGEDFFKSFVKKAPASTSTGFSGYNLKLLDNISTKEIFFDILDMLTLQSIVDDEDLFFDGIHSFLLYSQEQSIFNLLTRHFDGDFRLLTENENMGIYLTIDDLNTKLPLVHHYIFNLKKSEHFQNMLNYYYERIVQGQRLFIN